MDLLFPATRQRVLAQLLLNADSSFHLRELARLTGSHAGTLGRELDKLTEGGLVLRSEQGNQVRYQADAGCPLFAELAAMFRKTLGMVPLLREALAPLAGSIDVALVFGSMAQGTQSAGSDIYSASSSTLATASIMSTSRTSAASPGCTHSTSATASSAARCIPGLPKPCAR